jgi:hypothetical protein
MNPEVLRLIRTLSSLERSYAVIDARPVHYPYRPNTQPKATRKRKLAKVAKDMTMTMALLVG